MQKWKKVFAWIPVETLVCENQEEYYKVLQRADNAGDSTQFVEFMLGMIRNALKEIIVAVLELQMFRGIDNYIKQ